MKPTVYIETTIIGYLTSWPRQDVTIASHQQLTHEWWTSADSRFTLIASQLVVQECSAGDTEAAKDRLQVLTKLALLTITPEAEKLAELLISGHAIPQSHPEDALHIAIAAVNGVEYLVTWNFRHIANATVRSAIERICREAGYEPPIICTPEELLES